MEIGANAEELQEILNRIMQGIVSIITSALQDELFQIVVVPKRVSFI